MNDINHQSPLHHYAGQELSWFSTDSKKQFKTHLQERYKELNRYGWIGKIITYKINSLGFRSEEFDQSPSILALGCSYTFGVGLPIKDTWPSILAAKLNLNFWNLGIPGGANDTAFRLGYHYIPKLKPKYVFLLATEESRFEIINDHPDLLLPSHIHNPKFKAFYHAWIKNDTNIFLNKQKNILGLKELCNQQQIPFYHLDAMTVSTQSNVNTDARDLLHWGRSGNEFAADTFYSMIQKS